MAQLIDLRTLSLEELSSHSYSHDKNYLVSAPQTLSLPQDFDHWESIYAVVPNFIHYGRLLTTGRFGEFIQSGRFPLKMSASLLKMGANLLKTPLETAKQDFWVIADALLQFDLGIIGKDFQGSYILHPYLFDTGLAVQNTNMANDWLKHSQQRRGLWSHQLPLALSIIRTLGLRPETFICPISNEDTDSQLALKAAESSSFFKGTQWVQYEPSFT